MSVTFATCIYKIKSKFNLSQYVEWLQNFNINDNFNLVIFTDKNTFNEISDYIYHLKRPNVKIVIKDLNNFYTYNLKNFWENNHNNNYLLKHTSWELNMLWSEKVNFTKESMTHFKSDYYGWIDIGYFRDSSFDKYFCDINVINSLLKDKIYYALINNDHEYINYLLRMERNEKKLPIKPIPNDQVSVAGGFFITFKDNIEWFHNTYYDKLLTYFENNYLVKDDQIILTDIIFSNIGKFYLFTEKNRFKDPWFMFRRMLSLNSYRVTILMPIYNGIEYINESVSSILSQTLESWNLIIGINGHEQNSDVFKIAKEYEKQDRRISVYDLKVKGKSSALIEMMKYVKTPYVALLDVDDIWLPEKLHKQLNIQLLNIYDIIGTKCVYFGDIEGTVPYIPNNDCKNHDFLRSNPIINSSVILKTEHATWNESTTNGTEDYELWLKLWKEKKRFYNLTEVLIKHRIHESSAFNGKGNNISGSEIYNKLT